VTDVTVAICRVAAPYSEFSDLFLEIPHPLVSSSVRAPNRAGLLL
jgi:hypothetical protein